METVRNKVYTAIDGERAYQNMLNGRTLEIGEEILLLEEYVTRARVQWTGNFASEESILHMIRKVAGIAVRCMEHHGALGR